ncbi:MAG: hypothetical protein GX887_07425 [Firmicutes bacterium]|nr:hypothetical protein [Bacillota bacterium]
MKPSARNILLLLLTLSIFLFVGIGGLPVETVGDETDELLLFTSIASPVKPSENMICPSAISPKQSWVVEINELLFNGKVKKGDRLIFDLPGEAAHSFSVDRVNIDINGTLTIRGRHADDDFGYLLLTWDGDRVLSSIRNYDEQKEYIINYDSSRDRHLLHEVASRDADVIENGPPLIPPGEIGLQYVNPTLPEIDEEITIDVMIVYTPAARDHAAKSTGINTFITQAMELGQLALDNSDVGVQLRLVHFAEVDYTEHNGGMGTSTDLGRLQKKNDGYMDQVHAWRDQYGADLVNLFTECGDYGGLGYMLSSETPKPDYGFSITRVQQAWFTWTTLHEFGHNWGLGHSKEQTAGPGPGIYSYAAGWRWTGEDLELYASIMAYGEGVYTIVPHISNPDIWYQGARTGDKNNGDNARTTRQTKTIVAGYRPTVMKPKLITSFSFPEQTGPAVIDTRKRTVWIEVASGTDLTGLKAVFTLSGGATARVNGEEQISGETENDFSEPLTYTVEAEDGSTADWVVTVNVPVESLHLDVDRIVIREGEDAKLTATVEPADASDRRVTWSSDEEDIAAVDVTGKVTALSAGTATINACTVDGHFTAECEILVIGQDWDLEETTEVQRIIPDADGMAIASFPTLQAFLRIETTDHAGVVAMTSFDSGRLVLPPALLSIGSYIVPNISDNIDYTGMELEMGYRPQDFPGEVVENELRLFTDNDRSGVWQEVPDQHIDTGNKTITAHLGELTPLAIFDKVLFGDVDLDGEVDVADAIQILRVIVGLAEFSPAGMKRAVVSTGEGSFPNVADAILVLQKIVGLIGDFPVELN